MDFVSDFIQHQGATLVGRLMRQTNMDEPQARQFLPAAVAEMLAVARSVGFDLDAVLGGNASALLTRVDAGKLVEETGIDRLTVEYGLVVIAPTLLDGLRMRVGTGRELRMLFGHEERSMGD